MRDRPTARVLLFDPDGRILLMKGRLTDDPAAPSFWFTVGGGAEPGESLAQAAIREVAEETGLPGVELGPVVWVRESEMDLQGGERVLFKESYFVAYCPGGAPSRDGWEELEHRLVDDLRWWTLAEIAASTERIFPEGLSTMLPDIAAGRYPDEPLSLTVVSEGA
jgi:8-oxo-dGTP pyrophosphatase MutT (NUDIX family)